MSAPAPQGRARVPELILLRGLISAVLLIGPALWLGHLGIGLAEIPAAVAVLLMLATGMCAAAIAWIRRPARVHYDHPPAAPRHRKDRTA